MKASLVITTKNRKEELRKALTSALQQTAPIEIIVIDDGSNDGTSDMVSAEFPKVLLKRTIESRGLIVQRNWGARLATGEIVFSIDDDAEFSTPLIVEQTLRDFDDPRIGVVAIPYIEPNKNNQLMQVAPERSGLWITDTFIGTAHALRRAVFLDLGGYREALFHQGEESDYAIRLLDRGYIIRLGRADPVFHWESPKRDLRRIDYYGARNLILFQWKNTPIALIIPGMLVTTFNCLRLTLKPKRLWVRILGVCAGYRECFRQSRSAVRLETFLFWRRVRKKGSMLFDNELLNK